MNKVSLSLQGKQLMVFLLMIKFKLISNFRILLSTTLSIIGILIELIL